MSIKMAEDKTVNFTKFDRQLFKLIRISPLIYGANVIYRMAMGIEQYWGSLLIPVMVALALWIPSRGSLLFLRISTVILFVMHGLLAASIGLSLLYGEAGNVVLSHELVLRRSILSIYFFLLFIFINDYKALIVLEEKPFPVWKRLIVGVLALSIPFCQWTEQNLKTALDPTLIKYSEQMGEMHFSPDGKQLAIDSKDSVIIWDVQTKRVTKLISKKGEIWSVAFSQDGKYLAAGRESDKNDPNDNVYIDVWDLPSKQLMTLQRKEIIDKNNYTIVEAVAFSPDSRYLTSIMGDSKSGTVLIDRWNIDTHELLNTQQLLNARELHLGKGQGLRYSADSRYLAVMGNGGVVYLWDIIKGNLVRTLKTGYSSYGEMIAFSPDGRYLALAFNKPIKSKGRSHKGTIVIWELMTGEQVKTLEWDSDSRVYSLMYSPDGKYLASCGDEKIVRIWNAVSGEQVKILEGHPERLLRGGLTYSPDGKYLAARGSEYIKIWNLEP